MHLEKRKGQAGTAELGAAESSSSVLTARHHVSAAHRLRADPFSWEKQHKRQHGFSLSNTGLFTQANKPSYRAERDRKVEASSPGLTAY